MTVHTRSFSTILSRSTGIGGAALVILLLAGCGSAPVDAPQSLEPTVDGPSDTFQLTSSDADSDGYLPSSAQGDITPYCPGGENVSPSLEWIGAPDDTESFVLLMTDPSFNNYSHWVVTDIPADTTALSPAKNGAIDGGVVGSNARADGGYIGPCIADRAYDYTLYALDTTIDGDASTTASDVTTLMDGHILGTATVQLKRH
jgi:Raf kinase inhibitor-like YbhB/YbcL family protein